MTKGSKVEIRITDDEKASWASMAEAAGLTLSQWVRLRCHVEDGLTGKPAIVRTAVPRTDVQEVVMEMDI